MIQNWEYTFRYFTCLKNGVNYDDWLIEELNDINNAWQVVQVFPQGDDQYKVLMKREKK